MTTRITICNDGPDEVEVVETTGAKTTILPNDSFNTYLHTENLVTIREVKK